MRVGGWQAEFYNNKANQRCLAEAKRSLGSVEHAKNKDIKQCKPDQLLIIILNMINIVIDYSEE